MSENLNCPTHPNEAPTDYNDETPGNSHDSIIDDLPLNGPAKSSAYIEYSNTMSLFVIKAVPSASSINNLNNFDENMEDNLNCERPAAEENLNAPNNREELFEWELPFNPNLLEGETFIEEECTSQSEAPRPKEAKAPPTPKTTRPKKKYQNNGRKYKPDSIRKKIKSRTLKEIRNIFNKKIVNAGGYMYFDYFPQVFVSDIKVGINRKCLGMTIRDLYMTDFGGLPKDKEKLKNNLRVLKYLDDHPDVKKKGGFDLLLSCTLRKILNDYFLLGQFQNDLEKLKKEGEDEEYIIKYKYLAYTWVDFFEGTGIKNNKRLY